MAKATGLVNATKYDPNTVYTPRLSTVYFDWQWNCRSGVDDGNEVSGESGYIGLVQSLATEASEKSKANGSEIHPAAGQRDPIVCRPNPHYGKKGHPGAAYPLACVAGFSRGKAIMQIARGEQDVTLGKAGLDQAEVTKMHVADPFIRAFIRNMTEVEARKVNLGENMQRANLSAPDIAFGVAKLREAMPPETTADTIAILIGRSQPYTSKLFRIYQGLNGVVLPPGSLSKSQTEAIPVLEAWRKGTGKKPTNDEILSVAEAVNATGDKLTPAEKAAAYIAVTAPAAEKQKKKQGPGQWDSNACVDAHAFGVLLGNLERDGAIEIVGLEGKHAATVAAKYAAKIVSDKGTEDILDAIATACAAGVKEGKKKAKPVAVAEEVKKAQKVLDAPAEERAAKKSKKSAANGKAATA